jgi:hypothetical protein
MTHTPDSAVAIQRWIDHAEIAELILRYAKLFDERNFEVTLPALFSEDAHVELPPGDHRGLTGMGAFHDDVMAPFGATQHIFTNILTDVDSDRASFRCNTSVTHVVLPTSDSTSAGSDNLFVAGGVLSGTTIRTSAGWRFRRVNLEVIWRTGDFGSGPNAER